MQIEEGKVEGLLLAVKRRKLMCRRSGILNGTATMKRRLLHLTH
jgi:hypothetical protein